MPRRKFKEGDCVVFKKLIIKFYGWGGIDSFGYKYDEKLVGEVGIILKAEQSGGEKDSLPYQVKFDSANQSRPMNKREIRKATKNEEDKYYLMKYKD